jgi:hypothetical protein
VLPDEQAELAAAHLLDDQSRRDWACVVSHEVHCAVQRREGNGYAIHSGAGHDNRFNNPEYTKVLENLTGWQKRAWLDGDWDIAAGQFFTTFRRDVHVIDDFDDTRARRMVRGDGLWLHALHGRAAWAAGW